MEYLQLVETLKNYAEKDFADFQKKLIPTKATILGVRTPVLRKLAKAYKENFEKIFSFPDEYFEVTFIKLSVAALQPYERFVEILPECVAKIDNWATCDCFKAACIKRRKADFLSVLEKLFSHGGEFYERYVLVALLSNYVEEAYLPVIAEYLRKANDEAYYVHTGAAWLTAEVIVKHYDEGVKLLKARVLSPKTHNKAIQKARESFRLTTEQKEFLNSLKIKPTDGR